MGMLKKDADGVPHVGRAEDEKDDADGALHDEMCVMLDGTDA